MKRTFIQIALWLAALGSPAPAQNSFRSAALEAIHTALPSVATEEVQLLAIPSVHSPLHAVQVATARFDPVLRGWKLGLRCDPTAACIPALAFVHSDDRKLVLGTAGRSRKQIVLRPGDRKQLVIRTDAVRVTVPVVCLQRGAVGEQVRLREWKGTRIFLATVQSDSSLILRRAQ